MTRNWTKRWLREVSPPASVFIAGVVLAGVFIGSVGILAFEIAFMLVLLRWMRT